MQVVQSREDDMTEAHAQTPESILSYSDEYQDRSWDQYTLIQYAFWVINLADRATHRNVEKADKIAKDIYDAFNYLDMFASKAKYLSENKMKIDNECELSSAISMKNFKEAAEKSVFKTLGAELYFKEHGSLSMEKRLAVQNAFVQIKRYLCSVRNSLPESTQQKVVELRAG